LGLVLVFGEQKQRFGDHYKPKLVQHFDPGLTWVGVRLISGEVESDCDGKPLVYANLDA